MNEPGNEEETEFDRGDYDIDNNGDNVFTPIKPEVKLEAAGETPRKTKIGSRPASPLDRIMGGEGHFFPENTRLALNDSNDMIANAMAIAKNTGDLETLRASYYIKMAEFITDNLEQNQTTHMISLSKEFADLHKGVIGIGAKFDAEFACQMRLGKR